MEYAIVRLFETEIELVKNLSFCLNDLSLMSDFTIIDSFTLFDEKNFYYIQPINIKKFLAKSGITVYDDDVRNIFQRLDIDGDGKISFWEYKKILSLNDTKQAKKDVEEKYLISPIKKSNGNTNIMINSSSENNKKLQVNSNADSNSHSQRSKSTMMKTTNTSSLRGSFISKYSNFVCLEERAFQEYIKDILDMESELETLRCELTQKDDFTFQEAFRLIEPNTNFTISQSVFMCGLNLLDIYPNEAEIKLLCQRYNALSDLTYSNFCDILSPKDKKSLNKIRLKKINNQTALSDDTKTLFCQLIKYVLDCERKSEVWRNKLNKMKSFNVKQIFNKIDSSQRDYLIEDDIISYFRNNSISYTRQTIQLFKNRLDEDKDERINYNEFTNEFFPKLL